MRFVEIGGRLVELHVRESRRARRARAAVRFGEPPELVVPAGATDRAVERAIELHLPWFERQLRRAPQRVLDLPQLAEAEARERAREVMTAIAEAEAARLGVSYTRVAIRDQRTRWGSCSSRGTLSFSWRLVLAPHTVLDYVVVHELCHLREPNHSRRFWRLVGDLRPDYRLPRRWLRDHGWELHLYVPSHR